MKIKVLVADDEEKLLNLMKDILKKEGYTVDTASDGEAAIDLFFDNNDYDLVILDVMMPKADGWEVCKSIREFSSVPIIMLTALSDTKNEVKGLDNGANDYISKPFSYEVLLARINALLRYKKSEKEEVLIYEQVIIDGNSHETKISGHLIDLTPKEHELLKYLIKNKGRALSRSQILDHVWGFDYFGDIRTVDTHVKSLRAKINPYSDHIKTVRGIGYKLIEGDCNEK